MTKEEYIEKMYSDEDWAPGCDAIENEFSRLYPGIKPSHYEMTMKLKAENDQECLWALDTLSILARHTYRTGRFYGQWQCIPGNGTSIRKGSDSKITAMITVQDTSAKSQNTLHGKLDFIQIVGITEEELDAIRKDINNIKVLIELMKKDNPELVTDMNRMNSYL